MAEALTTLSEGVIKTGVYHADVPDARKEMLHRQWREGRVKVVCATIGELPQSDRCAPRPNSNSFQRSAWASTRATSASSYTTLYVILQLAPLCTLHLTPD